MMNALLEQANRMLATVRLNQQAHQISYEHHYLRELWIGGAAKVMSAIVGAGVFTVLVSKMGLSGSGSVSVAAGAKGLYWIVLFLCLAAPALTAVSLVRHDGKEAEEHLRCKYNYVPVQGQLEDFLREYDPSNPRNDGNDVQAEEKFKQIREKFNAAMAESDKIGLFQAAIDKAKLKLGNAAERP